MQGYLGNEGVQGLTFSGSYPITRLAVQDQALSNSDVETKLFAYSTLKPMRSRALVHAELCQQCSTVVPTALWIKYQL